MCKTQLEKCCEYIINIFHQYSIRTPPPDMLSKGEFAKMVKEQLPNVIRNTKNPEAMNRFFNELDQNKDGQVSFDEFVNLVSRLLTSTTSTEPAV
ncbi:protein S100-A12-like [Crotalus tigris]|uniref:protein S100-A12-like n=1 Tax=Crotalus tigris TaxID=88082 RepID=UPI00192F137F|nr:protein S100-A12-like [Crotalus tigris]